MEEAYKWSDYTKEELNELYRAGKLSGVEFSRRCLAMAAKETTQTDREDLLSNFIWFIKERESVRMKKEAGMERPWTDDAVLDKTKFTNIFRQDDRVSKFIFDAVEGMKGRELLYNLMVGRFINRTDALSKVLPNGNLEVLLEGEAAFLNSSAYQISPGLSYHNGYDTVREFIVYELEKRVDVVYSVIEAGDAVSECSSKMNKAFGGSAPFVFFQIALDWHYLTGQLIDSPVIRIGQGGSAIFQVLLNKIQDNPDYAENVRAFTADISELVEEVNQHLDRKLTPSDLEHAACEYRKYLHRQGKQLNRYSYVPNSMGIKE